MAKRFQCVALEMNYSHMENTQHWVKWAGGNCLMEQNYQENINEGSMFCQRENLIHDAFTLGTTNYKNIKDWGTGFTGSMMS